MAIRSTRLGITLLLVLALTLVSLPAFASHTAAHASEQITAIAAQAEHDMDDRVSAYGTEIASLQGLDQVLVAEAAAEDDVFSIWSTAKTAIEDLAKLYPGLGSVASKAKQQLLQKRSESLALIAALTSGWTPPATTTSTTSTTSTTTPTTTSTTTPTHGPPTTITPPGHASTTSTSSTTTTTLVNSVVVPPPPGGNGNGGSGGSGKPSGSGGPGSTTPEVVEPTVLAQTPAQVSSYNTSLLSESLEPTDTQVTEQMSAMLETVLPPAAVNLVLSPLLVLEILLRASLGGGEGIVVPLGLLAVCAVLISLADRFSKRTPKTPEPMIHGVV